MITSIKERVDVVFTNAPDDMSVAELATLKQKLMVALLKEEVAMMKLHEDPMLPTEHAL